ncbi:MAG: hypothetical protein SFZ03_06415 [Candidatus Melainabacteria bacterium]|nr:hypothetical protein [Candidatus Melainabacteria bacterium]
MSPVTNHRAFQVNLYAPVPPLRPPVHWNSSPQTKHVPPSPTEMSPFTYTLLQRAMAALQRDTFQLGQSATGSIQASPSAQEAQLPNAYALRPASGLATHFSEMDLKHVAMSEKTRQMFRQFFSLFHLERQVSSQVLLETLTQMDAHGPLTYERLEALNLEELAEAQQRVLTALKADKALFMALASLDGEAGQLSIQDVWLAGADQGSVTLSAQVLEGLKEALQRPEPDDPAAMPFEDLARWLLRQAGPRGAGLSYQGLKGINQQALVALSEADRAWVETLRSESEKGRLAQISPLDHDELTLAALRTYWVISHLAADLPAAMALTVLPPQPQGVSGVSALGQGKDAQLMNGDGRSTATVAAEVVPLSQADLKTLGEIFKRTGPVPIDALTHASRLNLQTPEEVRVMKAIQQPEILHALADNDGHPDTLSLKDVQLQLKYHVLLKVSATAISARVLPRRFVWSG